MGVVRPARGEHIFCTHWQPCSRADGAHAQRPTIEYYSQCVDVKIIGGGDQLPKPWATVPGHLPTAGTAYRDGFADPPCFMVGPQLATVTAL